MAKQVQLLLPEPNEVGGPLAATVEKEVIAAVATLLLAALVAEGGKDGDDEVGP